jgi:hypothetical protein
MFRQPQVAKVHFQELGIFFGKNDRDDVNEQRQRNSQPTVQVQPQRRGNGTVDDRKPPWSTGDKNGLRETSMNGNLKPGQVISAVHVKTPRRRRSQRN